LAKTFFGDALKAVGSIEFPMRDDNSTGLIAFCQAIFDALLPKDAVIPRIVPGNGSGQYNVCFGTNNASGKWESGSNQAQAHISFAFGGFTFEPTGYLLQMAEGSNTWKGWKVEGRVGDNYVPIDTQTGQTLKHDTGKCYAFAITKTVERYKELRITLTEVNGANNWNMTSNAIDFYGRLYAAS
jgi:hypothetical protein